MHSTTRVLSDSVHQLRYRIADLLAHIEAEENGLDPRTATLALLETAYGAALTFCSSPDRARHHVEVAVQNIHAGRLARPAAVRAPAASPLAASAFLATTVAVLSWATIAFLAHRGSLSPWNLLGPLFCTLLALVSAYRFLVASGQMRPWAFLSRQQRVRAL